VLKIAQYLQLPFPAAAALALAFPLGLRDTVYDNIAERRYDVFGKSNECRLSDGKFDSRFLS
jgi:predicted DCC family thiol-disulfide oxidoreductase YuxK